MSGYAKLTVAKLKQELTNRGIDLSGCKLKADYVAKLEEADAASPTAPDVVRVFVPLRIS